ALLVRRDLFDAAARENRLRPLFEDVGLVALARGVIAPLDEQPVVAFLPGGAAHAHQMPEAVQLFALELEVEPALGEPLVRIAARHPGAAIPHQHRAAAVLALRDRPSEVLL